MARRIWAVSVAVLMLGSIAGLYAPSASARQLPATGNPTLSTTLSAITISAGQSVYDTAALTGFVTGTAGSGGTVTYYLDLGSGSCSSSGTAPISVSTVTVSYNGVVPNSAPYTFNTHGPDSWNASYSGNGNNNPASSPCEPMNVTVSNDTITTTLSALSIVAGGSVHDTASLSGSTGNAGGTVQYEYFSGGSCLGTSSLVSTVAVSSAVVPNSASQSFATAGTYGWEAVYSGDTNNGPATSPCEPLNVTPKITSTRLTTQLSVGTIVAGQADSDSATLAGATSTASGTIQFELFDNGTCTPSGLLVSEAAVSGPGTYTSSSHLFLSAGTYSWDAVYLGDAVNAPATSACEPLPVHLTSPTVTTQLNVTANLTGNFHIPTSTADTSPCGIAYNPSDGHLYATLFGVSQVQDISGLTNATVGTFSVGQGPCSITYDSNNHDMYVADTDYLGGSGAVSVTSGASLVTTVPIPSSIPEGVGFDPVNDEIYVGSYGSQQITVLCDGAALCGGSPDANKIIGTVDLGAHRDAMFGAVVVDTANGRVFVPVIDAISGKYYVAVISGSSVLTNIAVPVQLGSDTGLFDPSTGDIYLSNDWLFTATVVVVSGATDAYVGTVSLFHSGGGTAGDVTLDTATGDVVASQPFGDLNILSGTSIVNHLPDLADSDAYDPANGEIFLGVYQPPTSYIEVLTTGVVVTDSARVTGTTLPASGTVTYEYFAGSSCSGAPTVVSTSPFTGSNPVGASSPRFFTSESYSYEAVYGGNLNNGPATSACEPFVSPFDQLGSPLHLPPSVSFFDFSASSLLVTNPAGAKTGYLSNGTRSGGVPSPSTRFAGAPGAIVGGPSSGPEFVSLPNASWGQYIVTLTGGSASGSSSNLSLLVQAGLANSTGSLNATYQGTTAPGEVQTFRVTVAPSGVTIQLLSASGGKSSTGFLGMPGDDGYVLVGGLAVAAAGGAAGVALWWRSPPPGRADVTVSDPAKPSDNTPPRKPFTR